MFEYLARLTRWNEWYESKTPLFFAAGYVWILLETPPVEAALVRLFLWLGFTVLYLSFGYALNDFSDRDVDLRAGKANAISELSTALGIGLLLAMVGVGILVLAPFYLEKCVALTVALCYVFAVTYSVPPIRFKERGIYGLIVSAIAQRSLPLLVGMALFKSFGLTSWLLVVLYSMIGIRWMMVHQLIDMHRDLQASVITFASVHGRVLTTRTMKRVIFPLEVASLTVWIMLASQELPALLLLVPLYGTWLVINIYLRKGSNVEYAWISYGRLPLTDFYLMIWPLFLATLCVMLNPIYLILVVIQIAWQMSYLRNQFLTMLYLIRGGNPGSTMS